MKGKRKEMMGALYEDVERFFGNIFSSYGKVVARWPIPFVIIPALVCSLLGLGMFYMKYETDIEYLYTPVDAQVWRDQTVLKKLFKNHNVGQFYSHQQITMGSYGEIIIRCKKSKCNLISPEMRTELQTVVDLIYNISFTNEGNVYTYKDLCAIQNNTCVEEGTQFISNRLCYSPNDTLTRATKSILGSTAILNNCVSARVLKLKFHLTNSYDSVDRELNLKWQTRFLNVASGYFSENIELCFTVSESRDIQTAEYVERDIKLFAFAVLVMLAYATVMGCGGDCVTNHIILAYSGVFAALLAIVASFAFLSLCGLNFVDMCAVMPFLVLGVGVDDMFQLMTEWRQTNIRDNIERRMASTLRSAAVSVTITSMTDVLMFCIAATIPFISVKTFCAYSGVAVLFCYINQLTFFSGCLVLHARRVVASRHCITCLKTEPRSELTSSGHNPVVAALCGGQAPRQFGEEGGICGKLSNLVYTTYPTFLLHWASKAFVILLFGAYIAVSIWGASQIRNDFTLDESVPSDSFLAKYEEWDRKYFPSDGAVVMFVIFQPVKYSQLETQKHIRAVLKKASNQLYVSGNTSVSWLDNYLQYLGNVSATTREPEFALKLNRDFLRRHSEFVGDIVLNHDNVSIVASRFYIQCRKLYSSNLEESMLLHMRRVANESPLPLIAYSNEFVHIEVYDSILKNTLLVVGVTMIGMLFVALVFIPHPIAVSCVAISMLSMVVGMVAFMHFWGVSLSATTTIQIVLSVGLCVNFTVHISHAFMTATGKNRNERVAVALEKVGVPILNGALSSLLSVCLLSLGKSFIYISFFKTMILVNFLALLHSLVFLPVMLSFIGPRRTSKPRVFVPVSPSCRSLQDTYRANSLVCKPSIPDWKMSNKPLIRAKTEPQLSHQWSSLTNIPMDEKTRRSMTTEQGRRVSFALGDEKGLRKLIQSKNPKEETLTEVSEIELGKVEDNQLEARCKFFIDSASPESTSD